MLQKVSRSVAAGRVLRPLLSGGRRLERAQRRCISLTGATGGPKKEADGDQVFPQEADVVIIGGGSVGCNTLYHLTKLGVTNVVLLEKDKLTAGTTWHTAGLVWSLRPNDVDIQLIEQMRMQMVSLEEETGVSPGWINNGGLFIANNKERLDEYKRLQTVGKAFGIESFVLSPQETKDLYPLMNVTDVYGTLYSPGDGTVDPNGFCSALTRAATRAGAKVIEGCAVTGVETKEGLFGSRIVTGLSTDKGPIKAQKVVNCTGVWSNYIAEMAGLKIPLVAMKHAYVTTDRIDGIMGMPNVRDHDASVYLKLQGDALHIGGYEMNPVFWEEVQKNFAFSLFELDWDVFGVHISGAINRIPVVEATGIKSTVCGPESFTPDHKPLLGEDPKLRGFFHGVGFNSAGLMMGGGCGQQLAHWVAHGRPDLDMFSYDIRRFSPELVTNREWVKARSHEAYAKNYSVVFPHDEPLAGRNAKKDPLHQELLEAGCIFQERQGWERPGWFSVSGANPVKTYDWYGAYGQEQHADHKYRDKLELDYTFAFPGHHENIRSECLSTRFHAALFNMSYFGKFYLSGPDAQAAADWIFSNRMDVAGGKTVYTCMLNDLGRIEADLTVSVIEGEKDIKGKSALNPFESERGFYIAAAGGASYHNLSHIRRTLQDKGFSDQRVHLHDLTDQMGLLSVQGPKSREVLEALVPGNNWTDEAFPVYGHKVVEVAGEKVRAMRVSFVGELGWELHVPNQSCAKIYQALMKAGRPFGLVNGAYRALDSLSIEKGYPHWHMEIRMDDSPLEAGLMFTCKLKTDTDFLGRKRVEEAKEKGARKRKICLTAARGERPNLLGLETIFRDGVPVGYVRRADYAFYLDKPVAYAYVRRPDGGRVTADWLRRGKYEIETLGVRVPAEAHLKTPFDPEGLRILGDYSGQKKLPAESFSQGVMQ